MSSRVSARFMGWRNIGPAHQAPTAERAGGNRIRIRRIRVRRFIYLKIRRWKALGSVLSLLGTEEYGFALKHFGREKERDGGVSAGRSENDGDIVPMIGADDQFLAQKTDVEDRNHGKLRVQVHAGQHGGDGRNDDDK